MLLHLITLLTIFRFDRCGYCGFYFITFVILVNYILIKFFDFLNPADKIDLAPDVSDYGRKKKKLTLKNSTS